MDDKNKYNVIESLVKTHLKRDYLKRATGNLGFVIETGNSFVCEVSQSLFNNEDGVLSNIKLGSSQVYDKSTLESIGANKSITYLLEGLIFDSKLIVDGNEGNVMFKNCMFLNGVSVAGAKEVFFEGNVYGDNIYEVIKTKNCSFVNIYNEDLSNYPSSNVIVDCDELFIEDSTLPCFKASCKLIDINNTNIINLGEVCAKKIYCDERKFCISNDIGMKRIRKN